MAHENALVRWQAPIVLGECDDFFCGERGLVRLLYVDHDGILLDEVAGQVCAFGCRELEPDFGEVGYKGDIEELREYPCNCIACLEAAGEVPRET